ncbi:hypothetical protein MRB53_040179 [Persea americana]|nr:hypothetical protein MRB53_040179 [Persea americana]
MIVLESKKLCLHPRCRTLVSLESQKLQDRSIAVVQSVDRHFSSTHRSFYATKNTRASQNIAELLNANGFLMSCDLLVIEAGVHSHQLFDRKARILPCISLKMKLVSWLDIVLSQPCHLIRAEPEQSLFMLPRLRQMLANHHNVEESETS